MDRGHLRELLVSLQNGDRSLDDALDVLTAQPGARIPDAHLDLQRELRTGHPEVVYGEGKTPEQIITTLQRFHQAKQNGLATRVNPEKAQIICEALPDVRWHSVARVLTWPATSPAPLPEDAPRIAVVCAGTSDLPVAEEAAVTAEAFGHPVDRITDIGVAGLHRLLSRLEDLRKPDVIIVVAGMEGALPSVMAGLLAQPIIAVPTSVGYGTNFGGIAALLSMLNACAAGLSIVNIDNGFGAALFASRILRRTR